MVKRYLLFFALSGLVIVCNFAALWWMQKNQPPAPAKKPAHVAAKKADKKGENKPQPKAEPDRSEAGKQAEEAEKEGPVPPEPARKEPELVFATLGSGDPGPYRMLATITNRGAAVQRIELNSPRFHDLEDRGGYLGHLEGARPSDKAGLLVRVVGPGTPAARAGLKAGDVITAVDDDLVIAVGQFDTLLHRHKPGDSLTLTVDRAGKKERLTATLARRPLEVVKPEGADPLSFLLTLNQIGDRKLAASDEELPGLRLRTSNWTMLPRDAQRPDEVSFEYALEKQQLRVVKTYGIARLKPEQQDDSNAPAYHLNLRVEVENLGQKSEQVAYRLDGPTGLPTEGWWYAANSKISRYWFSSPGIRDMIVGRLVGGRFQPDQINAMRFTEDKAPNPYTEVDLVYAGVDAQYVAAMVLPKVAGDAAVRFKELQPLRVGPVPADKNKKKLVDVSCRLVSEVATIEPQMSLSQEFQVFAGPKRPDLLDQYARPYGLGELVYYGWFGWVSVPMLSMLHFFYGLVGNYGLAIVMLTLLVRSCVFPLSRKQALSMAKMQDLQPELKKLPEKYKNPEERMRAQRELYHKHNINPWGGCLPALIQLPIFLGLYRSLSVDIELRQAPLISESVRWCSNLGAPDMLWYWKPYLPFDVITDEAAGYLGPYLNVLPLITIVLFLISQKMSLPPPADEQAAMQQKMMQWMMVVMGVMFFKVASGLCLYFIASSIWGIAERKLLPKPAPKGGATGGGATTARLSPPPGSNGSGKTSSRKPKQRNRK